MHPWGLGSDQRAAGVEFAILGKEEGCTGDSARRTGNEYLFQMMAQSATSSPKVASA